MDWTHMKSFSEETTQILVTCTSFHHLTSVHCTDNSSKNKSVCDCWKWPIAIAMPGPLCKTWNLLCEFSYSFHKSVEWWNKKNMDWVAFFIAFFKLLFSSQQCHVPRFVLPYACGKAACIITQSTIHVSDIEHVHKRNNAHDLANHSNWPVLQTFYKEA